MDSPLGQGRQKRAQVMVEGQSGRTHGSALVPPDTHTFDIALDATLRQSALRQLRHGLGLEWDGIAPEDWRQKRRFKPSEHLVVFTVDASDSMSDGARVRMRAAKGATLSLLRRAYQHRSRVAVVAFGGEEARVLLPPTASIQRARQCLQRLPTGGATPLADGLYQSWQLIRMERLKRPGLRLTLVVISDGEANVPRQAGVQVLPELQILAAAVRADKIPCVFMDVVGRFERSEPAQQLARWLAARYVRLDQITAQAILGQLNPK